MAAKAARVARKSKPDKQAKSRLGNLKNTEATQWKPGQSGNPAGRPPKEASLTSLLKEVIWEICPKDKEGRTWRELQVLALLTLAMKGNSVAIREIWSRLEGNVEQTLDINQNVKVSVEKAAEHLMDELGRISSRQGTKETIQ